MITQTKKKCPFDTVSDAFGWGMFYLMKAGLEDPKIEITSLLSHVLECSPTFLHVKASEKLTENQASQFMEMVRRRGRFEPVAYILNKKNFLGHDFYVDPRVLIPRPETEQVVETACRLLKERKVKKPKILDIGTGSGCMAISLCQFDPLAKVVALDISEEALDVAKKNAKNHRVNHQMKFLKSNLYLSLDPAFDGYFDMIISNPPYVSDSEMPGLEPDLSFEPPQALYGGRDGLLFINEIVKKGPRLLKRKGFLIIEIGANQKKRAEDIFRRTGFRSVRTVRDFSGLDRIVVGEWNGSI